MNQRTKALLVVVGLQCLFLAVWAGYHEWVRQSGEILLLRTRPVDPRDILRGDYMILNYDISRPSCLSGAQELKEGKDVFVTLEQHGEFHEAVAVSAQKPAVAAHQRVAKARLQHGWRGGPLLYGIEQYYVPEGKGTPNSTNITVQVTLSPSHRLNIKQVFVNVQPYP
jgi:uncharacterized membrane-anchored protein